MKQFDGKWVLVTGAGSGIGRAIAQLFARKGAHLLLVDVNDEGNEETRRLIAADGGEARTFSADVGDAGAMERLATEVHGEVPAVDVLVNNAGIGSAGHFLDVSLATWRKVIDINVMGVVHGCHYFLPKMVERGSGHVVNMASAAAFLPAAEMPAYASSKFAVLGLSESLRADMAQHGIGVSAICPGFINTPIVANTIMEGSMGADAGVREKIVNFYQKRNFTAEQVAEGVLSAVRHNTGVKPISPESWAMYYSRRLAPGLMGWLSSRGSPFSKE
jgi:NAD(P)-dependent dehydrogenase (short-subunit alcohol dehydrogenase family)